MKYKKKPIVIDATQWVRNGDHPKDDCRKIPEPDNSGDKFLSEGKIVRYYRHPKVEGHSYCKKCDLTMNEHGWIDTLEGGHIVCPFDFIIEGIKGEFYPCKPDIFKNTYDKVEG